MMLYCPISRAECTSICVARDLDSSPSCIFVRAALALENLEQTLHDISKSTDGIDANTRDIGFAIEKK